MDLFMKAAAMIMVTVVLTLFLGKWEKDIALLVSIAACCMAATASVSYLEPVMSLLSDLEAIGQLQSGMVGILIKAVGITLTAEIAAAICADAGNNSLAKILQLLGSGTVLYLAIPIFRSVLNVLTEIIGEL